MCHGTPPAPIPRVAPRRLKLGRCVVSENPVASDLTTRHAHLAHLDLPPPAFLHRYRRCDFPTLVRPQLDDGATNRPHPSPSPDSSQGGIRNPDPTQIAKEPRGGAMRPSTRTLRAARLSRQTCNTLPFSWGIRAFLTQIPLSPVAQSPHPGWRLQSPPPPPVTPHPRIRTSSIEALPQLRWGSPRANTDEKPM